MSEASPAGWAVNSPFDTPIPTIGRNAFAVLGNTHTSSIGNEPEQIGEGMFP